MYINKKSKYYKGLIKEVVLYLQINHELNEPLGVMHLVHGYRPCGKSSFSLELCFRKQEHEKYDEQTT